jgi:sarcosine oxidase
MTYDVAVVGLGGMGSAIAAHCASRGASVVGLEQFTAAHDLGSSHGRSRMIRKAYFEDAAYVPLVLRAYELWRELEQKTGENLLRITGVLSVGEESSEIITGTRRAAIEHNLAIEFWTRQEANAHYPTLKIRKEEIALLEPDGGVLDPECAVLAHLQVARSAGAQLRFGVTMGSWEAKGSEFEIRLVGGERISARTVVFSLGPWFQKTLEDFGIPIRVQRNVQAWFTPHTNAYDSVHFPAFLLDRADLPAPLYGFPDSGNGVKAAFHGFGDVTTAAQIDRGVQMERDVAPIVRAMEQWMPGAAETFREAKPCMYSLTTDGHFVIDRHPQHAKVILCGGFSGHGFKFAPVIGEICADLALKGESRHDIDFLSMRRFGVG